ncbi:MAG TPA: hypothetical protein VFC67_07435 [Prolixibacteraceae bacterium]|nr:hypothetical protein [Prolixibacteraceae bacterium]
MTLKDLFMFRYLVDIEGYLVGMCGYPVKTDVHQCLSEGGFSGGEST